jgi:hypothetical protein
MGSWTTSKVTIVSLKPTHQSGVLGPRPVRNFEYMLFDVDKSCIFCPLLELWARASILSQNAGCPHCLDTIDEHFMALRERTIVRAIHKIIVEKLGISLWSQMSYPERVSIFLATGHQTYVPALVGALNLKTCSNNLGQSRIDAARKREWIKSNGVL